MTENYRPATSYVGRTEEARQWQLENLLVGRAKRARRADTPSSGVRKFNSNCNECKGFWQK